MGMRSYTITHNVQLVTEDCCNCGVLFAIPQELQRELIHTKKAFYCPNGHNQHHIDKTPEERLAEERRAHASTQEELRIAQLAVATEKKRVAAEKKRTAAMKSRAAATRCPEADCHRTISPSQMARHIRTKHPNAVT